MKIDKLGWYENRNGDLRKVIYIHDEHVDYPIIAINSKACPTEYTTEGLFSETSEGKYDLIEYIGEELPAGKKFSEKIDKLGWYRQRDYNLAKVIHIHKYTKIWPIIAIDHNDNLVKYCFTGEYYTDKESDYDLIEYVGEELETGEST